MLITDPGSEFFPSRIRTKNLSILTQKFGFYGLFIPDPDPGSRIQGSKRHLVPDPDPQHWK
jgi:hypothetical protein